MTRRRISQLAAIAVSVLSLARADAAPPDRQIANLPTPVDLELVLAVDVSGSIDEEEAALQRQGYVDAITDPQVIKAITSGMLGRIAVTYFEWAGEGWQIPVIGWTILDSEDSARAFAAQLAAAPINTGPWTSIGDALDYAVPLFEANNLEATRRIIDISGDGPNNSGRMAPVARDAAVAKGITINGLPIMNDRPNFQRRPMPNLDLYYRHCVIGGRGAFIVVAENFRTFARAIRRKLILEIAGLAPEGNDTIAARGLAQNDPKVRMPRELKPDRWVPPCDAGEQRFRGVIVDP